MKATIEVQNLKCGGCAHTIHTKLSKLEGITDVTVAIDNSLVSFEFSNESNKESAEHTLIQIGYPPIGQENSLLTKTKSMVSCATGKLR